MSLYLLCFLQFGEVKSGNNITFTLFFAIWRGNKCKKNYIYCFLQFGELTSAKKPIFTVLFAIWRAEGGEGVHDKTRQAQDILFLAARCTTNVSSQR